jgi:rRNA maturation RNase YbeY
MLLQIGFLRYFEGKKEGEINYIFVMTNLHKINLEYLNHDDLTDIISFDYTMGNEIHGDIFISVERVQENAGFQSAFEEEIRRVMVHGVLHYCGYKDKGDEDELLMRSKENEKISVVPRGTIEI